MEDELARAGIRRVQLYFNGEQHQTRNLEFADDVVLLIVHEKEIQPALDTVQNVIKFLFEAKTVQSARSSSLIRRKEV